MGAGLASPSANHSQSVLKDLEAELFTAPRPVMSVGFEITSHLQGADAVEAVRRTSSAPKSERYSVAFVDVRMPPGINGVEAARQMHEIDPDLMIAFVTGYSDLSMREIEAQFPSDAGLYYVRKPFDAHQILSLASALSRKWDGAAPIGAHECIILESFDLHQLVAA